MFRSSDLRFGSLKNAPAWQVAKWPVVRLFELLALSGLLLAIFCTNILAIPFHADESQWIATSNVFEPFVSGDRRSPLWAESVWTLTQPPGTRFLIGIGRRAGGYEPNTLNIPWAFARDRAANIAAGAMPEAGLLWWSRLPMAIGGAAACLVSFYLLSALAGRISGYLGLGLLVANPFVLLVLRRAMAEAPLLLALLLATWIAIRLIQRTSAALPDQPFRLRSALWLLLLMGLCIGVAGSMKLSGLTALVGGLIVWLLVGLTPTIRSSAFGRAALLAGGSVLLIGSAAVVFVALNPYLDPAPIERTLKLIAFRANEMEKQQANPVFVIDTLAERVTLIYTYLFGYTAPLRFPGVSLIQVALWSAGLVQLLWRGWCSLRRDRAWDSGISFLIMAATCAGPMLLTPLNWDRYFLLPIWFSVLLIAVGGAWLVALLSKAVERRLSPQTT